MITIVDDGSGVGSLEHPCEGLLLGGADVVLAASICHVGEYSIGDAKAHLNHCGVPMRLDCSDRRGK